MIDFFKNIFLCIIGETCTASLHMLQYISGIQEVYDETVASNLYMLKYIPDHLKTQEMSDAAVHVHSGREKFRTPCGLLLSMPSILFFIPDHAGDV